MTNTVKYATLTSSFCQARIHFCCWNKWESTNWKLNGQKFSDSHLSFLTDTHTELPVIRPVLECASPVWHYAITHTQSQQLESIQKRAVHISISPRPSIFLCVVCCQLELAVRLTRQSFEIIFFSNHVPSFCLPPSSPPITFPRHLCYLQATVHHFLSSPNLTYKKCQSLMNYGLHKYQFPVVNT